MTEEQLPGVTYDLTVGPDRIHVKGEVPLENAVEFLQLLGKLSTDMAIIKDEEVQRVSRREVGDVGSFTDAVTLRDFGDFAEKSDHRYPSTRVWNLLIREFGHVDGEPDAYFPRFRLGDEQKGKPNQLDGASLINYVEEIEQRRGNRLPVGDLAPRGMGPSLMDFLSDFVQDRYRQDSASV